jgi:hypothetical protein
MSRVHRLALPVAVTAILAAMLSLACAEENHDC